MKTKQLILTVALLTCLSTLNLQLSTAFAQATAFTYQGKLAEGGTPANGRYDLRFILYDADAGGNQVGPLITTTGTITSVNPWANFSF
jgi:hypothetical protein